MPFENNHKKLAAALRTHMEATGLSASQLAKLSGTEIAKVKQILSGTAGRLHIGTVMRVVNSAGLLISAGPAPSAEEEAFQEARRCSNGWELEFIQADGGCLPDARFAEQVGLPVSLIVAMAARNELVYATIQGSRWWPLWQLHDGKPLEGLREVLEGLASRDHTGMTAMSFFTVETDVLYLSASDPRRLGVRRTDSPLTLLRRKGTAALPLILQHVNRYLEQGAT